jgi:hypothetical protein
VRLSKLTVTGIFTSLYIHSGQTARDFKGGSVVFQLRSYNYIVLFLVIPVLFAIPAFAQENQPARLAKKTNAPRQSAIASTASLTKNGQKKQLASVKNRLIAEKGKLWEELKTASTTNSNNAEQDKPAAPAASGDDTAELAKKLANPVASLISVPLQSNFDVRMGAGNGWRYTLNVQPVIPIKLSPNWNLISRTIIPIIHQGNVTGPNTSQSGLGDITQSLFFSPNKSEPFIWAVGPVFLIPTATNAALGTQKFGIGPTVLVLKQQHGWTVGFLGNHIWSVAGKSSRAPVNSTFVQPFLSYSTKDGWTYGVNTESTYDWTRNAWSIPIIPSVSKLVRFGKQPVSFGGGVKCWVTTASGGPETCSVRIIVTALFPKK